MELSSAKISMPKPALSMRGKKRIVASLVLDRYKSQGLQLFLCKCALHL